MIGAYGKKDRAAILRDFAGCEERIRCNMERRPEDPEPEPDEGSPEDLEKEGLEDDDEKDEPRD